MRNKDRISSTREFLNQYRDIKIVCPVCGKEYTPAEIYVPDSFFGKITSKFQSEVFTNWTGAIYPNECYVCDNCNTALRVSAHIDFETVVDERLSNNDYVAKIEEKLDLDENE